MKKVLPIAIAVLCGCICLFFNGCNIMQAVQLKDCTYTYSHISDVTFMDMTTKERRTLSGIAQVTKGLLGKTDKVTLGCTIHLNVTNPNKKTASMDRLFYAISLDSIQIAEGNNTTPFIVVGHSSADLPLIINVDLKTIMEQHSRATMVNTLKNFLGMSDTPTLVTVNLRPVIRMAGQSLAIPKSIPLVFEYGGKEEEKADLTSDNNPR